MKKTLVVANWKMNPTSLREAKAILLSIKKQITKLKKIGLVICPPAVYISELKRISTSNKISLGAQNCFELDKGPWTGKISPEMLKTSGAKFIILGHSENRQEGDDSKVINQKIKLALKTGLNIILCIGENQRNEDALYFGFLKKQILGALNGVNKNYLKNILIAYEPVWAIGKNSKEFITPDQLQEMIVFIKKVLVDKYNIKDFKDVRILYGGSVDYKNIESLVDTDVDGFLIGRASLNAEKFIKTLKLI
jgi:triosephosphate isomerase (TIM)